MPMHPKLFPDIGISGSAIAPCLRSPAGGTFFEVLNRPGLIQLLYFGLTRWLILFFSREMSHEESGFVNHFKVLIAEKMLKAYIV